MSEFEDAFDRVKAFLACVNDEILSNAIYWHDGDKYPVELSSSDVKIVIDRLDKMIKEQREEALSEMAKHDAELILKGY